MSEKRVPMFGETANERSCVLCESSDAAYTFRGCPVCRTCVDHFRGLNDASRSGSEPETP
jgi:hypothetical protein